MIKHCIGLCSRFSGKPLVGEAETPILGHLMQRANSLEKTLMLGKIECPRRREQQRMRWFNGITNLKDVSLSKLLEIDSEGQGHLACCSP